MTQHQFTILTWKLLIISVLLPAIAWGSSVQWQLGSLSPYQWFPLFGLLAWMIMWTHYSTGAIRIVTGFKKPRYYGGLTAWIVLGSLLLHPGILAFAQWQNSAGFPPVSFFDYVSQNLVLAVIFGSIALTIFLSFEIFDRIKDKPKIKKYWWIVSLSQSLAMILIFIHALQLGTRIQTGWFLWVWLLYGFLLVPCFYLIHKSDFEQLKKDQNNTVQ